MSDAKISWERDKHAILGGKVHLYRRGDADNWHCSTFLKGRNRRKNRMGGAYHWLAGVAPLAKCEVSGRTPRSCPPDVG